MTEPYYLIEEARKHSRKKDLEAEKYYKEAIEILEKRLDGADESKMYLWSTKAEYLYFKAGFIFPGETGEDARDRALNAIRYIYKCSKLDTTRKERFSENLRVMVSKVIEVFGCILPATETYVEVSCPIWLRQTSLGNMGMSIGAVYDKAICSICGLDLLDEKCNHQVGKKYDEKTCNIIKENFRLLHIALVSSPKEPISQIQTISYPKKEFFEKFDPEELKKAQELGLPLNCHQCREMGTDTSELNVEKFFEMQGLDLDIK